jgi:hypothetical protein
MNIITKFALGDTAFRLHDNKVQEVTIQHFLINVRPNVYKVPTVEIVYSLDLPTTRSRTEDTRAYEAELFATKLELLESL